MGMNGVSAEATKSRDKHDVEGIAARQLCEPVRKERCWKDLIRTGVKQFSHSNLSHFSPSYKSAPPANVLLRVGEASGATATYERTTVIGYCRRDSND